MYRGGEGQFAWALHRLTGLGVLLFLVIHILDTFVIVFGPALYNQVIELYRQPLFRLSEVGLAGAVLFHALNGMRITLMDFFPVLLDRQTQLFYAVVAIFTLVFVPGAWAMLKHVF